MVGDMGFCGVVELFFFVYLVKELCEWVVLKKMIFRVFFLVYVMKLVCVL